MKKTCETCRWWDNDFLYRGCGECERGGSDCGVPEHPDFGAWASDSEGWAASLRTKPSFGCNQWEARDGGK